MNSPRPRALAVLLVLFMAAGGTLAAEQVRIGAHGGISIPNLRGGNNEFSQGFTSRRGPFFGVFADFGLTRHFSLVVEINYTSQGGKRDGMQPVTGLPSDLPLPPDTIIYANYKNETILDYIEIPVMGRLAYGAKVRFFINAGPYIGFLHRGKTVTRGSSALYLDAGGTTPIVIPPSMNPLVVSFDADTDVKDSLKDTNFGLAGGGGIIYPVGPGNLILEAHFQLGLTTIQRNVETSGDNKTGAIIVSLGFEFSLLKSK
jgi:hypothetical protein